MSGSRGITFTSIFRNAGFFNLRFSDVKNSCSFNHQETLLANFTGLFNNSGTVDLQAGRLFLMGSASHSGRYISNSSL